MEHQISYRPGCRRARPILEKESPSAFGLCREARIGGSDRLRGNRDGPGGVEEGRRFAGGQKVM